MKEFNWLDFCTSCKSWCCHNENPFASKNELNLLEVTKISTKRDSSCTFLNKSCECNVYMNRPFECRIFPFDIQEINGNLFWVVWNICPATAKLNFEKMLDLFEREFTKIWTYDYIRKYVTYHKSNQPEKYSINKFKIIRELNWSAN